MPSRSRRGDSLLHVHAERLARRQGDQAVGTAVADVEADGRAQAVHPGEGLAVLAVAEGKHAIVAAQPLREDDAERGTTERELAPGTRCQEAPPAPLLLVIQQREGARLTLRVRREVHLEDGGAVHLAPGSPPAAIGGGHRSPGIAHGVPAARGRATTSKS